MNGQESVDFPQYYKEEKEKRKSELLDFTVPSVAQRLLRTNHSLTDTPTQVKTRHQNTC